MTKAELIEKMAKDAGITKVAAGKAYESFLGGLKGGLKTRGSKVTLVGFEIWKALFSTLFGRVFSWIFRGICRSRSRIFPRKAAVSFVFPPFVD